MCLLTYITSFGDEIGLGRKAPFLLTIIATFELLGKVVMSVISDQGWLQRRYIYMLTCTTSAVSILCEYKHYKFSKHLVGGPSIVNVGPLMTEIFNRR